jgi:hypothetical protein
LTTGQEPASPYKAVAKSVRTLRNRLEEADEALSGTSFAPEDIRVLEAAGESKNVLNKLDAVLQRDEGQAAEDGEAEDIAADLIAQFSVVVQKLSKALQDQEQVSGRADMLLAETRRKHDSHLSASTASASASVEHTRGLSRETSTRSSTTSHSSYDPERMSPEPAKLPAIAEQKVLGPARILGSSTSDVSIPAPSRSSSKAAMPDSSPDLRAGNGRSDAETARAAPYQIARAVSDPYQLNYFQAWPPHAAMPGAILPSQFMRPPYGGLQQPHSSTSLPNSLPGTPGPPPATMLPMRPRYYLPNPDPSISQPVELPGDIGKEMSGGARPTWPAGSPQVAYILPQYHQPPQEQHPALRYHYEMSQPPEGAHLARAMSPDQGQTQPEKRDSASTLRHTLSRTESTSSEALPSNMRMASPATASSTGPRASVASGKNPFDSAQIDQLIEQWNQSDWTRAEGTLQDLHRQAINFNQPDVARRLRHILGVVASVQGRWQQALVSFLSVLRAPIIDDGTLDDGDCAAAYWLGDAYCMLNRPAEALMAYLVAENGSLFRGTHLRQRILAEQKGCISIPASSNSANDWKASWEREEKKVDRNAADSILQPQALARSAEQKLLDRARIRAETRRDSAKQHVLDQNHSRVMAFRVLGADAGSYELDYRLKIGPSALEISGPWPLMFDPYFAMANVVRGRLIADPCDLLSLIKFDTSLQMPKAGSRNKKTYFTHHDLQWLIVTIRECLSSVKMTISEIANPTGCCFIARWSASSSFHEREKAREQVATFNFLTISVSRAGFGKSGYVLDVAGEGLYSARIIRGDWMYDKGIPTVETDRVRHMILDHLHTAAKQQKGSNFASRGPVDKTSKKKGALSFISVGSGDSRPASITSR